MKFKPLFDRVLIKPIVKNAETEFGLVLSNISKDRPDVGEVVGIGSGVGMDYADCKMFLHVGDRVKFNSFAGAEIEIENEKYIVIRQIDVMGVYYDGEENC